MQVRRDVRLADLTTLAVGGPVERLLEVETAEELVAAVRDADESGRPLLLLGGGSNVVAPDEGWPGDVVAVRTRGIRRDGDRLTVQAGEDWDGLVASHRRGAAGRHGGAVGDPRVHRRHPGAERRRLRPGGRADHHRRPGVRPRREARAAAHPGRVRVRLPRQPAQARARRASSSSRSSSPWRRARCRARSATRSWRAPSAWRSVSARRWPRSARRCSGCAAARAWSGTPPTPTRAAPARSSPTRSSRPARRRGLPELAGRRRAGQAQRGLAGAARRLRPRHPRRARRDVVPAQPGADHRGRRDRHRAARLRRPHHRDGAGALRRHPRPGAHRRPSPRPSRGQEGPRSTRTRSARRRGTCRGVVRRTTELSPPGGPCAGRPARGGARP